jgi:hypothetical protein
MSTRDVLRGSVKLISFGEEYKLDRLLNKLKKKREKPLHNFVHPVGGLVDLPS